MAAQSVHIDLVEAAGWLVWVFVALDRLADPAVGRRAALWTGVLGLALGLSALTGATEPLADGAVVVLVYWAWHLARTERGRRLVLAGRVGAGLVVGAAIGAAQLLPGSLLQSQSQRAGHTYAYFTSGSMNKSFLTLLVDPTLLGGSHSFPLGFSGTYNLPEISGYIGIMPVMAAVGLLARRHRRSPESSRWWIWYVLGGLGLVLTLGSFTPLGHLQYLLPLYNRQRLLARNLLEVDLALAVLFAAWLDHMLISPRASTGELPDVDAVADLDWRKWRCWPSDVVLPLIPVAVLVLLQALTSAAGPWLFDHFFRVPVGVTYGNLWRQDLILTVPSALAVAAAVAVLRARRGMAVARLVVAVVALDLVMFNLVIQEAPSSHQAVNGPTAASAALAVAVSQAGRGSGGELHRVALVDPDGYYVDQVNLLGEPDVNILRAMDSVQGYGAIVDRQYDAATGTHQQGNVDPSALAGGTAAGLDLGVLLTVPQDFLHLEIPPAAVPFGQVRLPPVGPDPSAPSVHEVAPPTVVKTFDNLPAAPTWSALTPGQPVTEYFGTVLAVRSVRIPLAHDRPGSAARLRLGLLGPGGQSVHWLEGPPGISLSGGVRVAVAGAPESAGLVVELVSPAPGGLSMGQAVLDTAGQGPTGSTAACGMR